MESGKGLVDLHAMLMEGLIAAEDAALKAGRGEGDAVEFQWWLEQVGRIRRPIAVVFATMCENDLLKAQVADLQARLVGALGTAHTKKTQKRTGVRNG